MVKGWHNEPRRHALASKGVKTAVDKKPLAKVPVVDTEMDELLQDMKGCPDCGSMRMEGLTPACCQYHLDEQQRVHNKKNHLNNIKITDIMSLEKKQELMNSTVEGFKSETISFTDLGYPDKKQFSVIIKGQEISINVPKGTTTRELNKQYKGKTLSGEIN